MRIVIAGGHGKIALRLERLLAARGDTPVGLIRNPAHAADVREAGAEPVVIDLEDTTVTQLTERVMGADAVVFAAGAGPGSGAERKATVDRDAARLLADAASLAGVRRYIMVSAIAVDEGPPPGSEPVWAAYVEAKRAADDELRRRSLETDWTILRPGRLTDGSGTGRVWLAPKVERGEIPREDVAAVIAALLDEPAAIGRVLELVGGSTPIRDAVEALGA
ncbi:SDR family oxidoreductase [Streptomonospora wellingtoniae]|uniref:SDR family oxidoreductase n=1 Tax=Streptomonospora wellingtoniae TaxID=3075544 RepID=A0ABU2KML4_9ACTN|nr:SDR family oxidoreductase [Streptomonospora sp. DSM 45055]MDT0300505.1 SDR family oxidoreductase [Streptomonospora sp. DSM 45055]